jgi:hypothetical protein
VITHFSPKNFRLPESLIHMDPMLIWTDVNGFVLVVDECFRRRLLETSFKSAR